jgi:uncharacterized protein with NRDE domain
MCTATWIRTSDGYEVFFNRDELATRGPASPPEVREREGVSFLAPTDGDASGTWLGVNDRGVSVGLANGTWSAGGEGGGPFRSRGLLVLDLLTAPGVDEAGQRLAEVDLFLYRPFELFALAPGETPRTWRWNGRALVPRDVAGEGALLVSSSRDAARARGEREALLARLVRERGRLDEELLAAFHASHEPERGAWSPCMHREDARTVSESRIRVGEREVAFEYQPGSPCERAGFVGKRIPRRASA